MDVLVSRQVSWLAGRGLFRSSRDKIPVTWSKQTLCLQLRGQRRPGSVGAHRLPS